MRHQQPAAWQTNLQAALPNTITKNPLVADWLGEREDRLAAYSPFVFEILGTNAVGALPELDAMIRDFTKPMTVSCASRALGGVGEPAIPILEAAIDAPGFPDPHTVFHSLRGLAKRGNTDALRVSDKALAAQRAQVPWLVAPTPPTNTPTQ
jgi:hypothetical protein